MKQTSLKSIARHMAAVSAGTVEKTNVIGIRKAINAIERGGFSGAEIVALFKLEEAIAARRPVVAGELRETGLKVLRNRRYARRWNEHQAGVIADFDRFELIRFDRINPRGWQGVPVFRVVAKDGRSFAFRNIPWQTAYFGGHEDGPCVVPERG